MNGVSEAFLELLDKGGPLMLPLVLTSLVLLGLVTERFLALRVEDRVTDADLARSLSALRQGDAGRLQALVARYSTTLTRLFQRVLALDGGPREPVAVVLARELTQLRLGMRWLAALTAVAPLLGLMGTVQGMIVTFDTLSSSGTGDVQALSRGISQALITTETGLVIALPGLVLGTFLRSRARTSESRLRLWAMRLDREENGHE
ncbi:MAG: MotA/TolQ/ExbB proton channel family protein [Planctomycetota bacterium]